MSAEQIPSAELPTLVDHVFALRRTGHHAVIAWLEASHKATGHPAQHINDAYVVHHRGDGAVAQALTKEDVLRQLRHKKGAVLLNYEDMVYDERHLSPAYRDLPGQDVLVVRDYANMMASRYGYLASVRKPHLGWRTSEDTARVWLGHVDLLLQSEQRETPVVGVKYNHWCTDSLYRDELALRLGITNTPPPKHVPKFGGGSSFDKQNLDGQAHNMNTLKRWRNLPPDIVEPYRRLLESASPTLRDYNKRVFGINLEEVLADLHNIEATPTSAEVLFDLR